MSFKFKRVLKGFLTLFGFLGVLSLTLIVFGVSYKVNKEESMLRNAKAVGCNHCSNNSDPAGGCDGGWCDVFITDNRNLEIPIPDRVYVATDQGNIVGYDVSSNISLSTNDIKAEDFLTNTDKQTINSDNLIFNKVGIYGSDGSIKALPYGGKWIDYNILSEEGRIVYVDPTLYYDPNTATASSVTTSLVSTLARVVRDYVAIYATFGMEMPKDWLAQLVLLLNNN